MASRAMAYASAVICASYIFSPISIRYLHFQRRAGQGASLMRVYVSTCPSSASRRATYSLAFMLYFASAFCYSSCIMFTLINVLTKGSVLTDNLIMQRIWAWTQCIAIDASVAGTVIRTFNYYHLRANRRRTLV